jgi:hypothetical protein
MLKNVNHQDHSNEGVQTEAYMPTPENIPAAPKPLSARPTINAIDVGAVADTTEPMLKMKNDVM